MTHRDDPSIGIIFTDGACLNNGQIDPKAGWAPGKAEVKNRDLWEALLGEAVRAHESGLNIALWHISRELNTVVDAAAKGAAEKHCAPEAWLEIMGLSSGPYHVML
ncbi:uncharacterized protein J7T54_000549 [Emericellopsis cladophorae]|uniref:RNase H type-1 domain-containing protein n=1 Tax=Emericellopsis cladophorae TaxID=2686198 RepID=A0A9P9XUN8_9HYPO|nr:uncharacterized protein J7T54_000549 [Emericellopsis cladophorae]KAI6777840.1 hypothetical protein J7T54_000549 [Emericellopsis cladophorae]